jgi:hypothetical protein
MPSGIVQSIDRRPGKSPVVLIDGQKYYAGATDLSGMSVGDKVEMDCASKNYRGETTWFLNGYKVLVKAQGPGPLVTRAPTAVTAPTGPAAATVKVMTEGERLTVSNWVAAAIAAGKVEGSADLLPWARAALCAYRGAADPDFVPF